MCNTAEIMKNTNELTIRVYYEDTDCGNIVYYANYLRYMERGRTELMRAVGCELSAYHQSGLTFVVIEANIKYKRPAHYDDVLTVVTSIKEITNATITFYTEICRDDTTLVYGDIKVACIKLSNGKPERIPSEISRLILRDMIVK